MIRKGEYMIDAIIFDCDGVIIDSEPIHLACFREVLKQEGLELSDEDYYGKYIGFDDHDCFQAVFQAAGREITEEKIAELKARKTVLIKKIFSTSVKPLPGAVELIQTAHAAGIGLAICSGALRDELAIITRTIGIDELIDVIVSADDVDRGKPDPQGYLLAMELLEKKLTRRIRPAHTWVIEDSPAGIIAAKKAGCKVLAITNAYNRPSLTNADKTVKSLNKVHLKDLR